MNKHENESILILDDDHIILLALQETLKLEGYTVVATSQPEEAIAYSQKQSFAIVMSDQRMAATTGIEFLSQIKILQPNSARILITGVLNVKTLTEAINKAEIFRFLAKPWTRDELLTLVRESIDRYSWLQSKEKFYADVLRLNESLTQENQYLRSLLNEMKKKAHNI